MLAKELLGLNPSAPSISQYITSLMGAARISSTGPPEIKSYPDVVYFNYYPLGISLLFTPKGAYRPKTGSVLDELQQDNLILDSIDIYNVPKVGSSCSELAFATFPISPILLPITTENAIERPEQLEVTRESTGKDFVKVLGEPDRKGGGTGPSSGSINIWCEWSNDGFMVEFGGAQAKGPHAWDTGKDAVWRVITVFRPGTKRD